MIDYSKIKVVIWDLDETFWKGTISEEIITPIPPNIQLVKNLTDMGIVNSICSKNNLQPVEKKLKELGIYQYFVFNSIDWNAKGTKIKKTLSDMGLRAVNALFLDDNHLNLEEAKYYNDGIMVGSPDDIKGLIDFSNKGEKKDITHKRLKQYQILEKKNKEKQIMGSNEQFLRSSNIRVDIKTDCLKEIDRLSEMILRTNQLNFTKNRMNKEELIQLIQTDGVVSGYVSVKDRFGDYGIVGMYVMKEGELIHFLFSCRTIGMGIEQYVYAYLNYPELEVIGTVIGEVNRSEKPDWINQNIELEENIKGNINKAKVLIKGPCDLKALFSYIDLENHADCEFTYINDNGVSDEQINHTSHIVEAKTLSREQKDKIIQELPFADKDMYSNIIYRNHYNVVFLSILNDVNLGVYKRKNTGELVAFTEAKYPLTDKENWEGYENGTLWNAGCELNEKFFEDFCSKYEFIGRLSPEDSVDNINYIRNNLPEDTLLVIMLGAETAFLNNKFEAYQDRHILHKQYNDAVRKYANNRENVTVLDVNQYITGQDSFYKHINHFVPRVYCEMAQDMVKLINQWTGM